MRWGQRYFKALFTLFLAFNGYKLFCFLRGGGGSMNPGGGTTHYNSPVIINNKNIPTIRFKTCDGYGEKVVIMVGGAGSTHLLQIAQDIWTKYENLPRIGELSSSRKRLASNVLNKLKRFLKSTLLESKPKNIWKSLHDWPFSDSLRLMSLGQVLRASSKANVTNVSNPTRGTQLKLELTLEGGQTALWKPQFYPRNVELLGSVHGGMDRHFGEIAAFHLNLLLGYNNAPIVVGRKLNLAKEVLPVASPLLKKTFYRDQNGSLCFYGLCHFCSKSKGVCSPPQGEKGEEMEGALILWIHNKFKTLPNPWRRTYGRKKAAWEIYPDFCHSLIQHTPNLTIQTILDIVGVSIFDFLIGNGDRHHLEVKNQGDEDPSPKIILLDNGKSFGNAEEDYLDILAPLFQCCMIRQSLYSTLKRFEGQLGPSLEELTRADPLYPLLTFEHLRALDRRLRIVLATVQYCNESIHKEKQDPRKPQQKLFHY